MLVKVYGGAIYGVDALTITVEVNIGKGVGYFLVGLPDNAIKESSHRIHAALLNTAMKFPGNKITINMAPADLRKEGSSYDLTLAIGILAASKQIKPGNLGNYLIMGELSLDGSLQPLKGVLPIAIQARKDGFKGVILPKQNAKEAAIVDNIDVLGVQHLKEVIEFFNEKKTIKPTQVETRTLFYKNQQKSTIDFEDVKGQENIKRCIEIAAAGGHNIILIGPPGAGKTMIAKRIPTILPPMSLHEALETTKIYSVSGRLKNNEGLLSARPFCSPHHTISDVALVGGGQYPQPGEISLAHNGVLFLDELPEFKRSVLEVLRQPLEDREVTIARAKYTITYPCSVMLVASMNPSPSGYFYDPNDSNSCTLQEMQKYLSKVSGPLLDRIDIHIELTPVPVDKLSETRKGESSKQIRSRVLNARKIQFERFVEYSDFNYNSQMSRNMIDKYCEISTECITILKTAMEKLNLSARAYDRILKVSRTIADLENQKNIMTHHITEAIQYRSLDREGWLG